MCELLGMSSNHRTTINLSLTTLAQRGENPKLHGDGWGVAFYEGNDVRLIKDSGEAKNSPWVDLIKAQEIHSHDIIAHIRKSTIGEVSYRNTHPFIRELCGRVHTFAHNGTLKDIQSNTHYSSTQYRPVGTTDSEYAFCILMDKMKDIWKKKNHVPHLKSRMEIIKEFTHDMKKLGTLNFLYSDGETLFAHGHQRHDPITERVEWPGLHYLQVICDRKERGFVESNKTGIALKGDNDIVTLFASVPLNDDNWHPLAEGQIMAVTKGEIRSSAA